VEDIKSFIALGRFVIITLLPLGKLIGMVIIMVGDAILVNHLWQKKNFIGSGIDITRGSENFLFLIFY
jgi:hypothetical protein